MQKGQRFLPQRLYILEKLERLEKYVKKPYILGKSRL